MYTMSALYIFICFFLLVTVATGMDSHHDHYDTVEEQGRPMTLRGVRRHIRRKRAATTRTWPDTTIPYMLSFKSLSEEQKQNITDAMKMWEEDTCIQFEPATKQCGADATCLKITDGEKECATDIGFLAAIPLRHMTLDDNKELECFTRLTLVHEFGHALGLVHEHNRKDRDDHLVIHQDNIKDGFDHNFEIQDTVHNHIPYDPYSIMHYHSHI